MWIHKLAKLKAYLDGSEFVTPDHIFPIIPSVLGHRIILSYEAKIDKIKSEDMVLKLAQDLV